jgi:hypothetical protein
MAFNKINSESLAAIIAIVGSDAVLSTPATIADYSHDETEDLVLLSRGSGQAKGYCGSSSIDAVL